MSLLETFKSGTHIQGEVTWAKVQGRRLVVDVNDQILGPVIISTTQKQRIVRWADGTDLPVQRWTLVKGDLVDENFRNIRNFQP